MFKAIKKYCAMDFQRLSTDSQREFVIGCLWLDVGGEGINEMIFVDLSIPILIYNSIVYPVPQAGLSRGLKMSSSCHLLI